MSLLNLIKSWAKRLHEPRISPPPLTLTLVRRCDNDEQAIAAGNALKAAYPEAQFWVSGVGETREATARVVASVLGPDTLAEPGQMIDLHYWSSVWPQPDDHWTTSSEIWPFTARLRKIAETTGATHFVFAASLPNFSHIFVQHVREGEIRTLQIEEGGDRLPRVIYLGDAVA